MDKTRIKELLKKFELDFLDNIEMWELTNEIFSTFYPEIDSKILDCYEGLEKPLIFALGMFIAIEAEEFNKRNTIIKLIEVL